MKITKAVALTFFIITASFSLVQVSTQASTGVKVGDWAKYKISMAWNSEAPNAIAPNSVTEAKNTEWKLVTVQKVVNTNITISVTTKFTNGTQGSISYTADIATNLGDYQFGYQIIQAGLDKGEPVRQSNLVINDTLTKEFISENREVNYASIRLVVEGVTNMEYYWDRQSGLLLKSLLFDLAYAQGYKTLTLMQTEITETNLWQPKSPQASPQPWEQWGPPLVIGTIAVVALLLIITRPKNKRTRRKSI